MGLTQVPLHTKLSWRYVEIQNDDETEFKSWAEKRRHSYNQNICDFLPDTKLIYELNSALQFLAKKLVISTQ